METTVNHTVLNVQKWSGEEILNVLYHHPQKMKTTVSDATNIDEK
jgi:hypothetical protein